MYRNKITLIVLSEDPIDERMDVADIVREYNEGDFVLFAEDVSSEKLTHREMAEALKEAGSDPSFFQLEAYEA